MLVDSHCHLDFPELRSDLDGVLARMAANGVTHALTISTTLETFSSCWQTSWERVLIGLDPDSTSVAEPGVLH